MSLDRPSRPFAEARAIRSFRFQSRDPIGDQKVANVRMCSIFAGPARFLGQPQRPARDFSFALFRAFADALDGMPVTIARGKIHPGIHAGRVLRQFRIDQAYGLKKIFPVEVREQPHARDDVADRDLRGGLAVVLFMDDLFDRETFFGELFLQPFHDRHHSGILFAQALRKLDGKRAAERLALRHPGHKQRRHFFRCALCQF